MRQLPPRPRILVVALQRLGDVLLTTPLIRSLRRAWPDAAIDVLVFADTTGILAGNPDIARVIAMPLRPGWRQSLALAARLVRRYDLALSTQTGDRPTFFAVLAGRRRAGLVGPGMNGTVKRLVLDHAVTAIAGTHRVSEGLAIAEALGIAAVPEVVAPQGATAPDTGGAPYAVIHAAPMFRYKRWTDAGWRALAVHLAARGLAGVATAGPGEAERAYLDALWSGLPVRRVEGLSWPALSALIAGAGVYVGPDTSVTHLAAATGAPCVAIFGPTDPRLWGPWPAGGLAEAWLAASPLQRRGNVWLIQNPLPCTPCQLEGCERRLDSFSRCLDELAPAPVIAAVDAALDRGAPPQGGAVGHRPVRDGAMSTAPRP